MDSIFTLFQTGLIVSCQAYSGEPLFGAEHMIAMALCAVQAGAVGIRANGPVDIRAIHTAVNVPVIGLYKIDLPGFTVRITPTLASAVDVANAGADIVALDATLRPHPEEKATATLIRKVKERTGKPILADIATFEDALAAVDAGADAVSTTLSGYTEDSPAQEAPDYLLVERLARRLNVPLIAEGRVSTPAQARRMLDLGASAVVVGTAITRPQWITAQFVNGMKK
jgi:N-acylglucosamine-6-phosphate 2-epimerase